MLILENLTKNLFHLRNKKNALQKNSEKAQLVSHSFLYVLINHSFTASFQESCINLLNCGKISPITIVAIYETKRELCLSFFDI